MKKYELTYNNLDDIFDFENSCSATDYTGLIPFAPRKKYNIKSYNNVLEYLASDLTSDLK